MIILSIPDLRGREAEYLASCNGVSSTEPFATAFEKQVAELAGRGHAVAKVNRTAALHLESIGTGVRKGDHVVSLDWTIATTADPVHHARAIPVFVDDVLTKVDFAKLHDFHFRHGHDGTIAVTRHDEEISDGVVRFCEDGLFAGIDENPLLSNFIAAGIYLLSLGFIYCLWVS
jgi:hypothetical protein